MSYNQSIPDTEWHENPKHAGKRTHIQKTKVTQFTEPNPFDVLSDLPSNKTSQDIYTTPGIYEDIKITGIGAVGVSSNEEDVTGQGLARGATDIRIDTLSDIPNKFGDVDISEKWAPRLDMYKAADHLVLEFELPGVEDPTLGWSNDKKSLVLRSWKGKDKGINEPNYNLKERHFGDFWRWVDLPTDITLDTDSAHASFSNGILKLKISISA